MQACKVKKGDIISTEDGPLRVRSSTPINDISQRIAFSATLICICRKDSEFTVMNEKDLENA